MKVALITGIYPPDIGGPATHVWHIRRYLEAQGVRTSLVTLGDGAGEAADDGYVHRVRRDLPLYRRLPLTAWRALQAARAADVLYVNGLPGEAAAAALLSRTPAVSKVVGNLAWERALRRRWTKAPDPEQFSRGRRSFGARLLVGHQRLTLAVSRAVVVPSQYLKQMALGWGVPQHKLRVIPNGVAAPVPPEARASAPRPGEPLRLIAVCRLVPWKGVAGMLELLSRLPEDVHLSVCGDGPEREPLERLGQRLGLDSRVRFAGALPPQDLERALGRAHCFWLNSAYEGLPHAVLEACRFGLPVVAPAVGGVPELFGGDAAGGLVPPGDPAAAERAIRSLRDDPRLWERLAAAGVRAAQAFSFEESASRTLALLEEVASADGARR